MKILLNNSHTPYNYNLVRQFPEFSFYCTKWDPRFRPKPENVTIIAADSAQSTFDAIIDDDFSIPFSHLNVRRKVFIHHNEHDHGDVVRVNNLNRALDWADNVVVVSGHKRASMRSLGLSDSVVVIEHSFDVTEWPARNGDLLGTWHNTMNDNQLSFFREVSRGIPHIIIGGGNDDKGFTTYFPKNFIEMRKMIQSIGVFVHVVTGEVFGLSPLEAMACGIPVVMGNCPEPWNFCFNGWNCFISRSPATESIEWIRQRVRFIIDNDTERHRMGAAARDSVYDYFRRLDTKTKWLNVLQ